MAHTKGPWKFNDDLAIVTDDKKQIHIALIETQGMGFAVMPNARLIAAAPDLLEAAKQLTGTPWYGNETVHAAFGKLQEAIAKAEGKKI